MKKIESCVKCGRALRKNYGYKVCYVRRFTSPITGKTETEELKGILCPLCNRHVGYAGSKRKLEKYKKSIQE